MMQMACVVQAQAAQHLQKCSQWQEAFMQLIAYDKFLNIVPKHTYAEL